jgi:signal transduction histidine kinase
VNALHRIAARTEAVSNLVLGLVLAVILAAATTLTGARGGNWVVDLAVGGVLGVLALLRGRSPARAAGAGLVIGGAAGVVSDLAHVPSQPGFAATAALLVLGAAVVRVAPVRLAALVAAGGVAVMVAGRWGLRSEIIAPAVFLGVLAWGCALGAGIWLRLLDTRRHQAIDAARRGERLELARELHDVVAHHIAGIVVQAQAARILAARRPETLDDTLAGIESAGTDALAAMRRVVGLLRDPGDAGGVTPGPEQLADLVGRFAAHGPAVRLRLPDRDRPPWPAGVATTVYRVVQEALTNVVLHAPGATSVTVTVNDFAAGGVSGPGGVSAAARGVGGVSVEITDDACAGGAAGGRIAAGGGHGLVGMRERVEALGGTLLAGPGPDGGWAVRATLPLPAGGGA